MEEVYILEKTSIYFTCPDSSNNIHLYHRIVQEILQYHEEVYQYLMVSLLGESLGLATIYIDPAWPTEFPHTMAYGQFRNCHNSTYQEVFLHQAAQLDNLCEMMLGSAHNRLGLHPNLIINRYHWFNFDLLNISNQ